MADLKPILLVEDSPKDLELTMAALAKSQLANEVVVARDGAEALDYLYGRGAMPDAPTATRPSCSSISSFPRSTGWRCWRS
jgi:hypothetical protein